MAEQDQLLRAGSDGGELLIRIVAEHHRDVRRVTRLRKFAVEIAEQHRHADLFRQMPAARVEQLLKLRIHSLIRRNDERHVEFGAAPAGSRLFERIRRHKSADRRPPFENPERFEIRQRAALPELTLGRQPLPAPVNPDCNLRKNMFPERIVLAADPIHRRLPFCLIPCAEKLP